MPIPATTGQLRTKISDMETGDYIKFQFNDQPQTTTSIAFGDAVNPATTEGEIAGQAYGYNLTRYGYMIKVNKGLLICDRVTSHSISWDLLNSTKSIQGFRWNSSNIAKGKQVTVVGSDPAGGGGSIITDGLTTGYQVSNSAAAPGETISDFYVVVDLGVILDITDVRALLRTDTDSQWNTSADVFYSIDNVNFAKFGKVTHLNQPTGIAISATEKNKNIVSARYIKVANFALNSSYSRGAINEIEIYETSGVIRSLTGGIAYADVNGNKSLTDQGYGAWPTRNEWDRYIVNFPTDKIQAGKTLDDVFHWSSAFTWCKNTFALGVLSATAQSRVLRGKVSAKEHNWGTSNTAQTTYAFRPVFDYQE